MQSKTQAEPSKKYRCLQIYYAVQPSDDVPVSVFRNETAPEKSVWTELPWPLKKGTVVQHSSFQAAGGRARGAATPAAGAGRQDQDNEDRTMHQNMPEGNCGAP